MAVRYYLAPWSVENGRVSNPVLQALEAEDAPITAEFYYAPADPQTGLPTKPDCVVAIEAADFGFLASITSPEHAPYIPGTQKIWWLEAFPFESSLENHLVSRGHTIPFNGLQAFPGFGPRAIQVLNPAFPGRRFKAASSQGTFTDDFTGTLADPLGERAGWTTIAGTDAACDIGSDNRCRVSNGGGVLSAYLCTDQGSADNYTQCRASAASFGSAGLRGSFLASRVVDENNYIGWKNHGSGSAGWRFCKVVAGTITDLITAQGAGDEWVRIECEGSDGRFYQGGTGATPSFTQTGATQDISDVTTTETSQGLIAGADNGSGGDSWLDDFEAGTLTNNINHTLPFEGFTFATLAPSHSVDLFHTLPVKNFTYAELAPSHSVVSGFTAHGVEFDGTNDYLTRGGGLTGAADGKLVSGSFWFKTAGSTTGRFLRGEAASNSVRFEALLGGGGADDNKLSFFGRNASGSTILNIKTDNAYADDKWRHVAYSFDLGNAANRHIFIDDVSAAFTVLLYTDDSLDLTLVDWAVGATPSGASLLTACLGELWFDDSYIDFSVETNRRKFISAEGLPVDLGSDGSTPTGTAPLIYLGGDGQEATGWENNKGSGGGFTENGALTDCATDPELQGNISHTIPVAAFTYATNAPQVFYDIDHALPVKAYSYSELAPQHVITLNHTLPVKQYTYATHAPVHFKDEVHLLGTAAFSYGTLAPVHFVAADIDHILPVKAFAYNIHAPVHAIDQLHDLAVKVFTYSTHAPTHKIQIDHLLPFAAFTYQTHTPLHFGFFTPEVDILSLDLTPPRETEEDLTRWLINNMTILQNVLKNGVTGQFETSDGRVLVVQNGIVTNIHLP